jgi:hypothetical protein
VQVLLPSWVVTSVAAVPGGARPSYTAGYYDRDNDYYQTWDAISRSRESFRLWLEQHVFDTAARTHKSWEARDERPRRRPRTAIYAGAPAANTAFAIAQSVFDEAAEP